MRWAYAVTTVVSRRRDLLPKTLASLAAGGFPAPRLCVDGDKDAASWEKEFGLEATARWPAILVHGNWVLSLYEIFIRAPDAERYAVFQDDFVCVKNLRSYLEACPYPDGPATGKNRPGYWNLYLAPSNEALAKGQTGWVESNQCGKGAVALVFSREAVVTLLSSRHLAERPMDSQRGWRAVDGGVVESFRKAGWVELVHYPSLVAHTGTNSSMDKRQRPTGRGDSFPIFTWGAQFQGTGFPGEDFDAMKFLRKPNREYWEKEVEAIRRAIEDDKIRLGQAATDGQRRHFERLVTTYTAKLEQAQKTLAEAHA